MRLWVLSVKSGEAYYALGADLGTVPLTLSGGVLSADSGVAEIVPESAEYNTNFNSEVPAKIGDKYLTITALNGPLALSAEKAFLWNILDHSYTTPLALFYGKIGADDTAVSGCITFRDGAFGTTQWGSVTDDNLYIYQKVCAHANAEEHPEKEAACQSGGNDRYFYCQDCGSYLNGEKEEKSESGGLYYEGSFDRYATGHHYVNGVCTYDPSHIALEYEPVTAGMDLFEEGYLYIIAAPVSGSSWKVMGFDPQGENPDYPGPGQGCSAVMGRDGKLRIDNANDGTWSAAEFRLNAYPDNAMPIIRVPENYTPGDNDPYGLKAPDNGSDICIPYTDTGYIMADNAWRPIQYPGEVEINHHPYSILVHSDGIAEIRVLVFSELFAPITYGKTSVYLPSGGMEERTCFYAPGFSSDPVEGSAAPNVRLFRAKAPEKYAVNTQIAESAMWVNILSDGEQNAVLAVCGYDADGRLTACETKNVTLTTGTVQEQVPVGDAAEYRVFLLDAAAYLPLNVKQYKQGA